MIKIHYISPSVFPSKSANSVHVIHQCSALSEENIALYLYGANEYKSSNFKNKLEVSYGADLSRVSFRLIKPIFKRAINLQIAIYAFTKLFLVSFKKEHIIYSRNLYAAALFNLFLKREIIYETHQIENGLNGYFQKWILKSKKTKTVLITNKLKIILESFFSIKINHCNILSDAAPSNIKPINSKLEKIKCLKENINYDFQNEFVCGYFGHLYEGRGIEIIIEISKMLKDVLFLVYGGNDADVKILKNKFDNKNLLLMGHVENAVARKIMLSVDALLMPYQEKVSIGLEGHDTARWMSPMKMFEYMATKNPIISSNLPALREVLEDQVNAVLVKCDDAYEWKKSLEDIIKDKIFANEISNNAFNDYVKKYNWNIRARKIIKIIKK